jgi:methylmalonyl-CoA/ethylmalonyl-CoA epimerase
MTATPETSAIAHLIGGDIDHLGIAVPDAAAATAFYRDVLGMEQTGHKVLAADGLDITFMLAKSPGLAVELVCPMPGSQPLRALLGNYTVQDFLRTQQQGGLHHVCFRVRDFDAAKRSLEACGIMPLGNGEGAAGASGFRIMFFAPASPAAVMIELKEMPAAPSQP